MDNDQHLQGRGSVTEAVTRGKVARKYYETTVSAFMMIWDSDAYGGLSGVAHHCEKVSILIGVGTREGKLCAFQAFLFTKTKSNWIKFQLRNKIRYFLHYFAPSDSFRNTTPNRTV